MALTRDQRDQFAREYAEGVLDDDALGRKYGLTRRQFGYYVKETGGKKDRSRAIKIEARAIEQERAARDASGNADALPSSGDIIRANAALQVQVTAEHRDRLRRMKVLHDAHLITQTIVADHAGELGEALLAIASSGGEGITADMLMSVQKGLQGLSDARQLKIVVEAGMLLIDGERKTWGIGSENESADVFEDWLRRIGR